MATTTRKRRSTDTRNDPHPLASGDQSIRLLRKPPDGVGNDFRINQDPPTPNNHPRTGATTRADEPSWHQLLRHTVEFSKNRRASSVHPQSRATGRRLGSNLPEFLARVFRLPASTAFLNSTRASFLSDPPFRADPTFRNPTRCSGGRFR